MKLLILEETLHAGKPVKKGDVIEAEGNAVAHLLNSERAEKFSEAGAARVASELASAKTPAAKASKPTKPASEEEKGK